MRIKRETYSIFKLKYPHDNSKVFILNIGTNKKINWRTINKQSSYGIQSIYGEQGVHCTQSCNVQCTTIVKYKVIYKLSILVN